MGRGNASQPSLSLSLYIEGTKAIADEITRLTRRQVTEDQVEKWSAPSRRDRLPVEWFMGRPGIAPERLVEWIASAMGRRKHAA